MSVSKKEEKHSTEQEKTYEDKNAEMLMEKVKKLQDTQENLIKELRVPLLQKLQKKLIDEFGEDGYNVFIYGKFLTDEYDFWNDHVKIAMYSSDQKKYFDLYICISEFFEEYHIPSTIWEVMINTPWIEPVDYIALHYSVKMTDYFPKELQQFYEKAREVYNNS